MIDNEIRLDSLSLPFAEGLYADYLADPGSVPEQWRRYFDSLKDRSGNGRARIGPSFEPPGLFRASGNGKNGHGAAGTVRRETEVANLQDRVDQLVRAYRVRGHMIAQIDPLGRPRPFPTELDPATHGLTEADMSREFSSNTIGGADRLTLAQILTRLRNTYCRSIGVQFMHIDDYALKSWLQERMESVENRLALTRDRQVRILTRLTDAVIFEEFIQKKFIGAKSFSLEGAESLIPLLELAIEKAGEQDLNELVLGMAHRGRLNVLANIMGKSAGDIFREFEDKEPEKSPGRGDVKYHLGYHNDWVTASGKEVHLALCFNPSHLEFVDPVVLGRTRAKQDRLGDIQRDKYLAILIHGDAAFAGEGIVQETLNLSQLPAYTTGGTVHVIVNNQIGFTTDPESGRSGVYATDIAKMLQSPIFHVNGEDPEAVAQVVDLCMDFRNTFKRDVFIDMYCYRRRGHNEGDEPSFTQPVLYREIERRKPVRDGYVEHLMKLGEITQREADEIAARQRAKLEQELQGVRREQPAQDQLRPSILGRVWKHYVGGPEAGMRDVDTTIAPGAVQELLIRQTELPKGFQPHPKIRRLLEGRREMARGERSLDWAAGEALAFASLAVEGHRVRLTGQDCERGTFGHRHAVLHDYDTGERYTPLENLTQGQAPVEIHNSPLSEAGVLGYEYGYSIAYPDGLVMWEAQFGDFWNAGQVIVDQFISSAEDKWGSLTGLVMLLPHGFEGMGPEHSSARLERFLMMAAEDNIQIVQPTTPAQLFHCLRRQVLRPWHKPLVVLTPKSLLRHPRVVSQPEDFAQGSFQRILPDRLPGRSRPPDRVILCSGKVYYDLEKQREDHGCYSCAVLRLEQFYPLPDETLEEALSEYPEGTRVTWAQEEPENMGAWRYIRHRFGEVMFGKYPLDGVYRPESASPATGSASSHRAELHRLFHEAIAACTCVEI